MWLIGGVAALTWSVYDGQPIDRAIAAAGLTLLVLPVAFTITVFVHELVHGVAAALLGQTVTRIVVGEGRALAKIGRDPQMVLGSVPLSNGITLVMDPRAEGYRRRWTMMLLAAPLASLAIGLVLWWLSAGWPFAARTAALVAAACNLGTAAVTLIPVPTFGGRVWSDLAMAQFLWHASDAHLQEHQLLSVQDRLAHFIEIGRTDTAVDLARTTARAHPSSTLAQSLLAYTLYRAGDREEATAIARAALADAPDDGSRSYLSRLIQDAAAPEGAA